MIATLKGKVTELLSNSAIIEIDGVGYEVRLTLNDLSQLKVGQSLKLYVHEYLREETHELYGFGEPESKLLFEQLISVSGVGPKMAMAIMSAVPPAAVRGAIASENIEALQVVSGVGRRTAARIVADLRNKVVGEAQDLSNLNSSNPAVEALKRLGYSPAHAKEAVAAIPDHLKSDEDRIKYALKEIGK